MNYELRHQEIERTMHDISASDRAWIWAVLVSYVGFLAACAWAVW